MIKLEQNNSLKVIELGDKGTFVDAREYGQVFLRNAPTTLQKGDVIDAFLYRDASDKILATLTSSLVNVNECALLKVVSVGKFGAFLDWGMPKDLLLPHAEQAYPVREGGSYVVYVVQDNSDRLIASTMLHKYLEEDGLELQKGDAVDLLIAAESDLGFKAVINNQQLGLIYHSDLSQPLKFGSRMKGWVKNIREDDGKIDLSINTLDDKTRDQLEMRILKALQQENGKLELSDKSSPEAIFTTFKVSKKNFKRALGSLYKQKLIAINPSYIELID
jgi:predicted RNA-binding protein (virulence factor B family)